MSKQDAAVIVLRVENNDPWWRVTVIGDEGAYATNNNTDLGKALAMAAGAVLSECRERWAYPT